MHLGEEKGSLLEQAVRQGLPASGEERPGPHVVHVGGEEPPGGEVDFGVLLLIQPGFDQGTPVSIVLSQSLRRPDRKGPFALEGLLLGGFEFLEPRAPDQSELVELLDELLHDGRVLLDGSRDLVEGMLAVALLERRHDLGRDDHGLIAQQERIPQGDRLLILVVVDRQGLDSAEMGPVDVFWTVGHGW